MTVTIPCAKHAEQKKPDAKIHIIGFHYYETLEDKSLTYGLESRAVLAWGRSGAGAYLPNGEACEGTRCGDADVL